jgi:isopentenyl-diphosphate delta-isomerase
MDKVILVDKNDQEIGSEEKLKAHQEGKLHRAFSIFIFNSKGEWLLQKRARAKYHSGGQWTNACCSHPRPGETILQAAHRRLKEEMGFDTELKEIFSFVYKVKFKNGLWEHEFDHVLIGDFDGRPKPSPEEAEDWRWLNLAQLKRKVRKNPGQYTYWFRQVLEKVAKHRQRLTI